MFLQFYGCLLLLAESFIISNIDTAKLNSWNLIIVISGLILLNLLSGLLIWRGYRDYKRLYIKIPISIRIIDIMCKIILFIITSAFLGWLDNRFLFID